MSRRHSTNEVSSDELGCSVPKMMSNYEQRPWDQFWSADMLRPNTPEHSSALAMFRTAALTAPDAPLISYFDRTLTADEVDFASDAVAARLQAAGVDQGDRIALYLQNVPEFVVAVLAAWKCGVTIVPINPMYREHELRTLLLDSGARALIVLEHLWFEVAQTVVEDTDITLVITTNGLRYLDDTAQRPSILQNVEPVPVAGAEDFHELVAEWSGRRPKPTDVIPDDIAFLCYTSGTTGPPKGAMITHGGVVFNAQTFRNMRGLTTDDIVFAVAPLFHITGLICTIAVALLLPMRMVLSYRFDVSESLFLIERYKATFTVGATTVFIAFLEHPEFYSRDISSLKKIICGGAPIPPAVLDRYERATGVYMYNGYGLTETTSPTFGVPSGQRCPVDPVSGALALGVPLPGTECRLVTDDGTNADINQPGEITVRGPHVVPGYWHNPEETANAIHEGWLSTGDVATMDKDGWFYLVDRKKDQINAAGYKVWPREVEEVLYQHPAVREAAVVGVPDRYRGETVKAVVSLRPRHRATAEELGTFCKAHLAAYKCPKLVEIREALPKTMSGKILRRELR